MNRSGMYRSTAVAIFLCLFVFESIACSHEKTEKIRPKVWVTITGDPEFTQLDKKILSYFREAVKQKADLVQQPLFELFVNARLLRDQSGNRIVLSVVSTETLPDEVVQLGKKNEIFYSIYGTRKKWKNLPPEGKKIREYVTAEYLRPFCNIRSHKIFIVPESQLKTKCEEIAVSLLQQWGIK